jgi:Kef-type K+ transport system membrane component KefB
MSALTTRGQFLSRPLRFVFATLGILLLTPQAALGVTNGDLFENHTILLIALITLAAWCGYISERLGMPELVGEIFAGIVLGNLALVGINLDISQQLRESEFMAYGAELGVVLLLFVVGLESNIRDLLRVGMNATRVAVSGVILPVGLGVGAALLLGFSTGLGAWFIGATLAATSVGITARSLGDEIIHTPSAQVILGAAVIDDVLGLLLLAVLAGIAITGDVSFDALSLILIKAVAFFAVAILIGPRIMPTLVRVTSANKRARFWTGFAFCTALGFAELAALAGLAPLIGAFVAGLLLDDLSFEVGGELQLHTVERLIKPIMDIMLTIFFVSIGAQVQLQTLFDPATLFAVAVLLAVAIVSKGAAGFSVRGRRFDRLGIGAGMIPRGEVGLIFAAYALGHGVFDAQDYSLLVAVVLLTTILGPILLKPRLQYFPQLGRSHPRSIDSSGN